MNAEYPNVPALTGTPIGLLFPPSPLLNGSKITREYPAHLAVSVGVDERRIRHIIDREYPTVSIEFVDKVLITSNASTGLWELYPGLYD